LLRGSRNELERARLSRHCVLGLDHHALLAQYYSYQSTPMAALGQSRQVFEILSKSLGMVPVVGENLKSAAELASKICEEIEVRKGS
jgi:hypothetical protein